MHSGRAWPQNVCTQAALICKKHAGAYCPCFPVLRLPGFGAPSFPAASLLAFALGAGFSALTVSRTWACRRLTAGRSKPSSGSSSSLPSCSFQLLVLNRLLQLGGEVVKGDLLQQLLQACACLLQGGQGRCCAGGLLLVRKSGALGSLLALLFFLCSSSRLLASPCSLQQVQVVVLGP